MRTEDVISAEDCGLRGMQKFLIDSLNQWRNGVIPLAQSSALSPQS